MQEENKLPVKSFKFVEQYEWHKEKPPMYQVNWNKN